MHYQGFKYEEIAEDLSLPLGTVKSRIFFARKQMQSYLKKGIRALLISFHKILSGFRRDRKQRKILPRQVVPPDNFCIPVILQEFCMTFLQVFHLKCQMPESPCFRP